MTQPHLNKHLISPLPVRRVVFQPDSYLGMQRGINQMAEAIRPTLGPLPRTVAFARLVTDRTPEVLDNGATIAKRLIEFPDRDADMGAMFLRHVLQHVQDQAGDGTATAAVILQTVYNEGVRYLAAGGNPMPLRRHLEAGTQLILRELNRMTHHLAGEESLVRLAHSICHEEPLAKLLGEIFDIIGEYGRLEVRGGQRRTHTRRYVEGLYWPGSVFSRDMFTDLTRLRTTLTDAAIFMSNLNLKQPEQLLPVLELARQGGVRALLVIARSLSGDALGLVAANSQSDDFRVMAVRAPGDGSDGQAAALQDMAVLTGGRPILMAGGQTDLSHMALADLGRARRVWVEQENFGIVGGKGNPRALRAYIAELREGLNQTQSLSERQTLQERLSKLISGSAVLTVGGGTDLEIRTRQEKAQHTADAIRGALIDGVLPGAGVALLNCRPALQARLEAATSPDERAAYRILLQALQEPARTIAANAGYSPSETLGQVDRAGPTDGFDVMTGRVVDVCQAGILDPAKAQKTALQSAVASAALALTTEVLVHHKKPAMPALTGPGSR